MFFRRNVFPICTTAAPAGNVRHHQHARRRGRNAAGRADPPHRSDAVSAGTLLPQGTRTLGRSIGIRDPRASWHLAPQDRYQRALAAGSANAAAADRCRRHRRRRRQDVLGPPGGPVGGRAGNRVGIALHRLADRVQLANRLLAPITDASSPSQSRTAAIWRNTRVARRQRSRRFPTA